MRKEKEKAAIKSPDTRSRLALLWLLTAATLLFYTLDYYHLLAKPGYDFARYSGWLLSYGPEGPVVTAVDETDEYGQPEPAFVGGARPGDVLKRITDVRGATRELHGYFDFLAVASTVRYGEPWYVTVLRKDTSGKLAEVVLSMPPQPRPKLSELLLNVLAEVVLPLLMVVAALFVGFHRPGDRVAFLACLLFLCCGLFFMGPRYAFPPGLREFMIIYWWGGTVFLPYLILRFFLLFPAPSPIERHLPWLKHVMLAYTLVALVMTTASPITLGNSYQAYRHYIPVFLPFLTVHHWVTLGMIGLGFVSLLSNALFGESRDDRRRMAIFVAGSLVGIVPTILYFNLHQVAHYKYTVGWTTFFVALTALFPISFAYVVVKHRVFGIRVILRQGLRYMLVSRGFLAAEGVLLFLLLFFVAGPLFARLLPAAGPAAVAVCTALMAAGLVAGLLEVNRRVMPAIDRRFFRESYNAQRILGDLAHAVRHLAGEPGRLARTVAGRIVDSLHADHAALFLRGTELAKLGDAKGGRWSGNGKEDFYCYLCLRRSSEAGEAGWEDPAAEWLSLDAGSLCVGQLEGLLAAGELETLEVYLDDPGSWTARLSQGEEGEAEPRERSLLASLGTRLLVPLASKSRLLGFLSLGDKRSEEPYSREDMELLIAVAQQAALALDYAGLIRGATDQAAIRRELEIAGEVQRNLFPHARPPMKTLDYAGSCRPARGVGGDYYDFIRVGEGRLGLALADVSGKGVSAALLMANLQALLRSRAGARGEDVGALAGEINKLLCESTNASKFVTFFYGVYDDATRLFTYVNAGHNPPLLIRSGGPQGTLERAFLEGLGTGLGIFGGVVYQRHAVELMPGDVLVVYSDGVTEAFDKEGGEFGDERLAEAVSAARDRSAAEIQKAILDAVVRFAGDAPQSDDITLVVGKVV